MFNVVVDWMMRKIGKRDIKEEKIFFLINITGICQELCCVMQ
jgi:hypothetical protein